MLNLVKPIDFGCLASYILEMVTGVDIQQLQPFFDDLPVDPYLVGNYRFRRLSHFRVEEAPDSGGAVPRLTRMPHRRLFQSSSYNPLLGDVVREYPELDERLIQLDDFQKIVWEFFQFCQLCTPHHEVAVHQIRTTAASNSVGNPAPEGIHRDGVDLVGIFSVQRKEIEGAETHLYTDKTGKPLLSKVLAPGEMLVFRDSQYFHYTTPIQTTADQGVRDVFVLTCPGLFPPDET